MIHWALLGLLAAPSAAAPPDDLTLAFLRQGRVLTRGGTLAEGRVPLGSLWKLFVFAYVVERGVETPSYRCGTPARPGDEYCCDPGRSIDRDDALQHSCGNFFEPRRLGIEASAWRAFWSQRAGTEAGWWLLELSHLEPATRVPVPALLGALEEVPALARAAASRALLPLVIDGYGQGAARDLGGLLRVKTFTWDHPRQAGARLGGAAGWLVDGTPVWFAARGSSRSVLASSSARLAAWLPEPVPGGTLDDACVVVDYFERYPLRAVDGVPTREPAQPGPLFGRFRASFENGNTLPFASRGELSLVTESGRLRIVGRLLESEYLARVLDREADPGAGEAARALAIVARTWLAQNATFESGCYHVADSTRAQRVSPRPASAEARRVALFTDGLLLRGATARYRRDGDDPGALVWTRAVAEARAGEPFDRILAKAFPQASLGAGTGEEECRQLPAVQAWLTQTMPRWSRALAAAPGFEAPGETLTVCALDHGNPYVDRARSRIYLRGLTGREDRLTLAHEYVHVAFRFHPNGLDEDFVERTARSLMPE